jgi:signal peptidase I
MKSQETTKKRRVTPLRLAISAFILFWVMAGYIFLYTGKVAAVEVISGSMEPTIMTGDRILVKRFIEGVPQRGSIVVLNSPDDNGPDLVKRIVAVPGDEVKMRNGALFVNNHPDHAMEGYIHLTVDDFTLVVPEHQYFVLGDNRDRSYDSTEFGPVDRSLINGIVWLRYAPLARSGSVE